MIIHQTMLQKELAKLPNVLDFKRAVVHREIEDSKEIINQVRRLEAGVAGENLLVQKLKEFGKTDWTIIRNLRLKDFSTFEMDLVLLTRSCVYLFEVKNYTGSFEFNQGNSYFNGIELNSNIIQQTRNAFVNLKNICSEYSRNIRIKGILVFIGENNQVSIQSDTGDIRVLKLTDLHAFIREITEEENLNRFPTFDIEGLLAHLETFEITNNYLPVPLTAEEIELARGGISCSRCLSYDVTISRNYIKCSCGLHEPREEAMVRTICEYGMLTYDRDLTKGEVFKFLDGNASEKYLIKILQQHFETVNKNRYTYYENYQLPYNLIREHFYIEKPVIYYNRRGFPEVYLLN